MKTNEGADGGTGVLGQIDLHGRRVTADALHTVKATAEYICQGGGEFILPVKENRKTLFEAVEAQPWHQVPNAHTATDRWPRPGYDPHHPGVAGVGRPAVLARETGLPYWLVERLVRDLARQPGLTAVAALGRG